VTTVWTTRTGTVLHATPSCPTLDGRKILKLDRSDALPGSTLCTTPLCRMVRGRAREKAA